MIKAIKAINKTTKSKQSVRGINILRKSHNFHDMKSSRASSGMIFLYLKLNQKIKYR